MFNFCIVSERLNPVCIMVKLSLLESTQLFIISFVKGSIFHYVDTLGFEDQLHLNVVNKGSSKEWKFIRLPRSQDAGCRELPLYGHCPLNSAKCTDLDLRWLLRKST